MTVPNRYAHLLAPGVPSLIREAVKLYGVTEKQGRANNPVILEWADEVEKALGNRLGYNADSIPWCGLYAGVVAVRAGWVKQMPQTPLWARSWLSFGVESPDPAFGDVLVFGREGGGHVGFYAGEDHDAYHVLGGNQGDAVNVARVAKRRFLGARRPRWRISQPASVRPIIMGASGPLSSNEA